MESRHVKHGRRNKKQVDAKEDMRTRNNEDMVKLVSTTQLTICDEQNEEIHQRCCYTIVTNG